MNNLDTRGSGARRPGAWPQTLDVASRTETIVTGQFDYVSWLSDDTLVAVGRTPSDGELSLQAVLHLGDRTVPLDTRHLSFPIPESASTGASTGVLLTARTTPREGVREQLKNLVIRSGSRDFLADPSNLSQVETGLQTLVRNGLAPLAPETRTSVLEFLAAAQLGHTGERSSLQLNKNLFMVREALRERFPYCTNAPADSQGLGIDALLVIDEQSFFISGWLHDPEGRITQLTAVSPEGSRADLDLLEHAFRYPRPDIQQLFGATGADQEERHGFMCFFELAAPSVLPNGWVIEMRDASGAGFETTTPPLIQDFLTVRNRILGELAHERAPSDALKRDHAFPALSRLQKRQRGMVEVESALQFGDCPDTPQVSIVIPLFGRIDFLEHQLAQFADDPELRRADLIYVLDSPEYVGTIGVIAAWLFDLYRVPFRVVILKRNVGYSLANNVGAAQAHGRLLLLLNSDVLPDRPGWLGKMAAFYDSTPGIGAAGAKLLYEDDTLQHAGMYFYRPGGTSLWENKHYYKGLHRQLPAANVPRRVHAVTGAAMMIARELYDQLGGFEGSYVQGDYEDSDLCLRLMECGYENWYCPEAELYHLEGQSYSAPLRQLTSKYNTWLHTHLWGERIESVVAQTLPSATGSSVAVHAEARRFPPVSAPYLAT